MGSIEEEKSILWTDIHKWESQESTCVNPRSVSSPSTAILVTFSLNCVLPSTGLPSPAGEGVQKSWPPLLDARATA